MGPKGAKIQSWLLFALKRCAKGKRKNERPGVRTPGRFDYSSISETIIPLAGSTSQARLLMTVYR
jgi:hypothetical protein